MVGSDLRAPWGMQVAHTYPWPDAEMSTQPCAHAADICMQSTTKKTLLYIQLIYKPDRIS